MPKNYISYGIIFKRSSCLNTPITESKSSYNIDKRFSNLQSQLEKADGYISPSVKSFLYSLVESLSDYTNANRYYKDFLKCIGQLNQIDQSYGDKLVNEYCTRILPYVTKLSGICETLDRYDISPDQKGMIIESANQYNIADRIMYNHDKISKRFNIESEVSKIKSKGFRNIVESCCRMIDTFTIKPYQKLNLCIEEMTYLLNKNGIDYNPKDLVSYALEYYLLNSDTLSEKDLSNYRLALTESYCLEEEDLVNVQYIFKPEDCNNDISIKSSEQQFLISPNKTTGLIDMMVSNIIQNGSKTDIIYNFDKIVYLLLKLQTNSILDNGNWGDIDIDSIFNRLVSRISYSIDNDDIENSYTREDLSKLISNLSLIIDNLKGNIDDNYEYVSLLAKYRTSIENLIGKLTYLQGLLYSRYNIESMNYVNGEVVPLNEFKIFKFHNLVKAAINLDKYLKLRSRKIYSKCKSKASMMIKRAENILFENDANIYDYINEDGMVDICVAQYYIDESNINDIHEEFNNICKEYNDQLALEGRFSCKSYYLINPGILEVHVKESNIIGLSEEDRNIMSKSEYPALNLYIEEFAMVEATLESFVEYDSDNKVKPVSDILSGFYDRELSLEHYEVAMEALSLLEVSKEDVDVFTEDFSNYLYKEYIESGDEITESDYKSIMKSIREISNDWCAESEVPFDIQWEAYQILNTVLLEAPQVTKPKVGPKKSNLKLHTPNPPKVNSKKPSTGNKKDNKDDKKEGKKIPFDIKNPFKGINIKSMRLYLEGLKGRMKDMSQKEKEASRNLDNAFRRFVKAMKDCLVSDQREAIIKGSVIPSFSKCIKLSIGLAGIGVATGNPAVPLIIAIGGFIASKRLTQRERLLLLDEIETELEVLDKEIALAESRNQLKKYRTLLRYKKDLQRQYQRIRYNIRIGKDILPGSAVGVGVGDQD